MRFHRVPLAASIDHDDVCTLNFCNMSHNMAYWSRFDVDWASAPGNFERQGARIFPKRASDSTDKAHFPSEKRT
jgi:hypothetical protein